MTRDQVKQHPASARPGHLARVQADPITSSVSPKERSLSLEEHEARCRRCGRCCYEKHIIGDRVFLTRLPCRYLDTRTNLCTIYEKRHEICPGCLDVPTGIEFGVFPADCPYVQDIPGYRPPFPIELDDDLIERIENGEIAQAEELIRILEERAAAHPSH